MPTMLAPHFSLEELTQRFTGTPTPAQRANLSHLAQGLELIRRVAGVPFRVTSGLRSTERNVTVGGSPTSDHPAGLAADLVPQGISLLELHRRLTAPGVTLPTFDQIIYYPFTAGHVHIGFGPRSRREFRVEVYEGAGGKPLLTDDLLDRFPGGQAGAAFAGVLLVLLVLFVLFSLD